MTAFIGPEQWAAPREAEWEQAVTTGTEPDTFAEELEAQEFEERHKPLPAWQLEQLSSPRFHRHARATDPVPPSYVKRSAA